MSINQTHRWMPKVLEHLSFVLRPMCLHCQRPAVNRLCRDCWRRFQQCERSHPLCAGKSHLSVHLDQLPQLYGWGDYRGLLKQGLLQLKYDGQAQWAEVMGEELAKMWLKAAIAVPVDGVVPIPLHRGREVKRGYNQAALIARRFCEVTGLRYYPHGLVREKSTTAQFGLSARERQQNLQDAFRVGADLKRKKPSLKLLLLDDIFTTGITMHAAVDALQSAGFQVSALVAVAIAQNAQDKT
jgi:ComF family protein